MKLTKEEIAKNIEIGKDPRNIAIWANIFFKEALRYSAPKKYHYEIYSLLYSTWKKIVISVPRGRAKTTLARIFLTHRIVYPELYDRNGKLLYFDKLIGYKSNTEGLAAQTIRSIMNTFEYDDFFIMHYGRLKDPRNWTDTDCSFLNGVTLQGFGANQSMRGRNKNDWRFTTIIADDVDSLDDSKSYTVMDKHWEKIERDDIPALDPIYGKFRLMGTVVSADCCVQRAINYSEEPDSDWHSVIYRGLNENGESIWPEVFPTEQLLKERDMAIRHNNYSFWLSENMNEISDENTRVFKKDYFRYWDGYVERRGDDLYIIIEDLYKLNGNQKVTLLDDKPIEKKVNAFIGIDPAGEDSKGDSDFWGITVSLVDSKGNYYIAEFIEKKLTSVSFFELLFQLHSIYNFKRGIFESNAGFGNIKSLLYEKMRELNQFITIQWEKASKEKRQRISDGLESRWQAGAIYHKRDMVQLEAEALDHPNLVHEDGMDSLEKAIRISRIKPTETKTVIKPKSNWRQRVFKGGKNKLTTDDILLTQG